MLKTNDLYPIGIGTWGIGGFVERDPENDDEKQVTALRHMLDNGMNFVELCPWYSEGKAVELFIDALNNSKIEREDLFIVASIYPYDHDSTKGAEQEFENLLSLLNTDYVDSVQFTGSSLIKWGFDKSVKLHEKLMNQKLSRYVSLTNVNMDTLGQYNKLFDDKFFSHELHYSFEVRETEDFGLIQYAEENDIQNVIFQPLRRNRTADRNWALLVEIANKYGKTQNQIIMNWLVSRGFLVITKSESIEHIDEHVESVYFEIEEVDLERINNFRPPGWKTPEIDWDRSGKGVVIHNLPNIFDEEYDKQVEK